MIFSDNTGILMDVAEMVICLGEFDHDLNQRPKPIDDG